MRIEATPWSEPNTSTPPPRTSLFARASGRAVVRIALAAGGTGLLLVLPLLVDDYVLSAVLVPLLALSLAGIGQNFVTGYAGQLSVGSAAFMSVGAFAAYDLHLHLHGTPLLVSLAFGGVSAAAAGALFGLPSLRIRGFYLVASTLAAQFFVEWSFTKVGWFFIFCQRRNLFRRNLRPKKIHLHSVPHKMLSAQFVMNRHMHPRRLFLQSRKRRRRRFPPQPQLAHPKILQHSGEPPDVILVRMRQRHRIQLFDPA